MDKKEGNILIANYRYPNWQIELKMDPEQLTFDSSWEALMPVVIQIMDYHLPDYWGATEPDKMEKYDNCCYPRTFGMRSPEGLYMVRFNGSTLCYGETLIAATWNAVIDFVTWFNTTKDGKR